MVFGLDLVQVAIMGYAVEIGFEFLSILKHSHVTAFFTKLLLVELLFISIGWEGCSHLPLHVLSCSNKSLFDQGTIVR